MTGVEIAKQSGFGLSYKVIQTEKMRNFPGSSLKRKIFSTWSGQWQFTNWASAGERKSVQRSAIRGDGQGDLLRTSHWSRKVSNAIKRHRISITGECESTTTHKEDWRGWGQKRKGAVRHRPAMPRGSACGPAHGGRGNWWSKLRTQVVPVCITSILSCLRLTKSFSLYNMLLSSMFLSKNYKLQ